MKKRKCRVTAGKPANHSSIRAGSRACGANLCDLRKGPLQGEPFFLPCNGKEKLGNFFDQQSKNKESKEQMGSFVHKTAKSVLAFSVLRTALPPYIEYIHIAMGSWDICCIILENPSVQN